MAALLRPSVVGAVFCEAQAKLAETTVSARPLSLRNQACRSNTQFLGSASQFNPLVSTLVRRKLNGTFDSRKSRRVAAASSSSEASSEGGRQSRTKAKQDVASLREKVTDYIEKKSGYFWLGGPAVGTAAVVIPPVLFSVVELLQKNFFVGLFATFALDAIFVLAADLFFVVADKAGHQQAVPGGPPPWIGPWEYTGYPKGEPTLTKVVSYAGVAIGALGLVVSLFLGKLAVGLPALGSYLALIFIQVAYERLLINDRVPAFPLVPIVYTVYRFKQLARGMEIVNAMGGGFSLAFTIRLLMVVWTFYLGLRLTQLPWLYSTWNSNRAT